ncbi:Fungalysin metallopeptidase-domain-containing protein [Geranomyces variabilis]|nr:Fungalysin metallopeptidase-domain-containing protein [Geranomyces variabilis]KAJ3131350.1 Fungalysin/Thermolysin Extracellular metalloproteinase 5 [Geranomyces variabilis]
MRSLFASALLVASASSILAAPAPSQSVTLPQPFHRVAKYQGFGVDGVLPASLSAIADDRQIALAYIASQAGLQIGDLAVTDDYTGSNGLRHVYVKRLVDGKPVSSQVANASVKDGKIFVFGSTIAGNPVPRASFAGISVSGADAQAAAERAFGLVRNDVAPVQRFVETLENVVEPVWAVQVQSAPREKLQWLEVDVSAWTGKIVSATSWVSDFKYTHAKFTATDPRNNLVVADENPFLPAASPKGWHNNGGGTVNLASGGNNAHVVSGLPTKAAWGIDYGKVYDFSKPADDANNVQAGRTNAWVTTNFMHDLSFMYGFNEKAGNFQKTNWKADGGVGGDEVFVSVQDGGGKDNADFATPPDGQQGRMNLYQFTGTPNRDGAMDTGVIIHEYGHGISNRLTGGPANSNCLDQAESQGLGEGWSDFFFIVATRKKTHTANDDVVLGTYSMADPRGFRTHPYSTNMARNPYTYSSAFSAGQPLEAHTVGEVWATMLFEMFWAIVNNNIKLGKKPGIDEDIFHPPALPIAGNQVALQLVMDAFAIQPCSPTFQQARDAILQADKVRNHGYNICAIWKAFAKRGLGVDSAAQRDGYKMIDSC